MIEVIGTENSVKAKGYIRYLLSRRVWWHTQKIRAQLRGVKSCSQPKSGEQLSGPVSASEEENSLTGELHLGCEDKPTSLSARPRERAPMVG